MHKLCRGVARMHLDTLVRGGHGPPRFRVGSRDFIGGNLASLLLEAVTLYDFVERCAPRSAEPKGEDGLNALLHRTALEAEEAVLSRRIE